MSSVALVASSPTRLKVAEKQSGATIVKLIRNDEDHIDQLRKLCKALAMILRRIRGFPFEKPYERALHELVHRRHGPFGKIQPCSVLVSGIER